LQVINAANSVEFADFWLKFNGSNYPNSSTKVSLAPRKDSSTPSAQLVTISFTGDATAANDYVEIFWTVSSLDVSLQYEAASGIYPAIPSVIASMTQVMYTQVGPTGPTGATGPVGEEVPAGGTTGQILIKQSNTDYDYIWGDTIDGGTP